MKTNVVIAPSILSADFSQLGVEVQKIASSGAQWIHIDIMDGHFVPNLTFGSKIVADIRPLTDLYFDAHLMVDNPGDLFLPLKEAGVQNITFHWEAAIHHHRLIQNLKELGLKAGISIVPSTPVESLIPILPELDLVLIMSVNPGFGGQKHLPFTNDKVKFLHDYRTTQGLRYLIQVDGGINRSTFLETINQGADILVTGSAFFSDSDPEDFVRTLSQTKA